MGNNEFEIAEVNEPSLFEPLKFYCIWGLVPRRQNCTTNSTNGIPMEIKIDSAEVRNDDSCQTPRCKFLKNGFRSESLCENAETTTALKPVWWEKVFLGSKLILMNSYIISVNHGPGLYI